MKQPMKQHSISYYKDKLKNEGLKVTPQRVEVIRALLDLDHPTASEIQAKIEKQYPMISPSTVYGALELLEEIGELIPIQEGAETRYDLAPRTHPHLICIDTGRVHDLDVEKINQKLSELMELGPDNIQRVELNFYGNCENRELSSNKK